MWCPRCAIESNHSKTCPLCNAALQTEKPEAPSTFPEDEGPDPVPRTSWRELDRRLFNALSAFILLPLLVTFFLDMGVNHTLSWSRFVIIPLIFTWLTAAALIFRINRGQKLFAEINCYLFALFLLLDLSGNGLSWAPEVVLPILGTAFFLLLPLFNKSFLNRAGLSGTASYLLMTIGLICLVTDILAKRFLSAPAFPFWSLLVIACLLPPGLFLCYVRFRIAKAVDLKKIFHS